jgi:hypothetical protein
VCIRSVKPSLIISLHAHTLLSTNRAQSRECEKLLQKNRALRRDNARMQSEIKQKVESERLLATRTHFFQKLIKKLREKIAAGNLAVSEYHQQLAAFQSAHGAGKGGAAQLAPRLFASEELIKSLHLRCQEMGAAFRAAQARLDGLEAELSHCRDIHDVLLSSQDAVTTLTLTCLEDAKLKAVADRAHRAPPNSNAQSASAAVSSASSIALDDLNSDERRRVVQQLVRRLANFQGAHRIGLFDDLLVSSADDAGAAEGALLEEPVEQAHEPSTAMPDHAGSRPTTVEAARPATAAAASATRPSSQPPTPGRSTAAPSRTDASRQSASRVSNARMPPSPALRPPASPAPASLAATGGSTAWEHARVPDALAEKLARVQGPLRSWGQKADAAGKRH